MKAFFKEHFVLIAGISLPLILSLAFFLSANIKQATEDPPQYDVIFASRYYPNASNNPYKVEVNNDGGLEIEYRPPEDDNRHYRDAPHLYVYRVESEEIEHLSLPDIDEDVKGTYTIYELKGAKISDKVASPDGYHFKSYYRGGGNLMTEVFGAGGHRSRYVTSLEKDGYEKRLDMDELRATGGYYNNTVFIGWIIEKPAP